MDFSPLKLKSAKKKTTTTKQAKNDSGTTLEFEE